MLKIFHLSVLILFSSLFNSFPSSLGFLNLIFIFICFHEMWHILLYISTSQEPQFDSLIICWLYSCIAFFGLLHAEVTIWSTASSHFPIISSTRLLCQLLHISRNCYFHKGQIKGTQFIWNNTAADERQHVSLHGMELKGRVQASGDQYEQQQNNTQCKHFTTILL